MLRLFGRGRRPRSARRSRPAAIRRPQLEALEERVCLSFSPVAPEFPVNTTALFGDLSNQSVAVGMDAQGDFVVVWTAATTESEEFVSFNVFAQRFDRDGNALGSEILVTPEAVFGPSFGNGRVTADVAMAADGDFVIVYDVSELLGDRVVASFFDSDGHLQTTQIASGQGLPSFFNAYSPAVAVDAAGNAVVAYVGNAFGPSEVYVQRFDASGNYVGNAIQLTNDEIGFGNGLSVGRQGDGTIIATWGAETAAGVGVFACLVSADGTVQGGPFTVAIVKSNPTPSVGASSSGNFVIAWDAIVPDSFSFGVQARVYDASGKPLTDAFDVSTASSQFVNGPNVAVNEHGDFAVSWGTGLSSTVLFRQFRADGTPVGPQQQVNSATQDFSPNDIAMSPCGEMVIAFLGTQDPETAASSQVLARLYRDPDCHDTPIPVVDIPVEVPHEAPQPTPPVDDDLSDILIALVSSPSQAVQRTNEPAGPVPISLFFSDLLPTAIGIRRYDDPFTPLIRLSASDEPGVLGEISGRVFLDVNGDGVQESGEPGLRGQAVFLDQNDNGVPDELEPVIETDGRGNYHFAGLRLTKYRVRQDLRNRRLLQTIPELNGPQIVELTVKMNSIPDVDFGTKLLPTSASTPQGPTTPEPASPVTAPATQTDDSEGNGAEKEPAAKEQAGPPKSASEGND